MDERWPDDGRLGVEFHGLRRQCGTEVDRLLGLERLEVSSARQNSAIAAPR
jgi:hypothetical protein